MANNFNDGGPAFPVARYFRDGSVKEPEGTDKGMTLRDYLAAKAPNQNTEVTSKAAELLVGRPMPDWKPPMEHDVEAATAYTIDRLKFRAELDVALRLMWADAMLAARKKGEN